MIEVIFYADEGEDDDDDWDDEEFERDEREWDEFIAEVREQGLWRPWLARACTGEAPCSIHAEVAF